MTNALILIGMMLAISAAVVLLDLWSQRRLRKHK